MSIRAFMTQRATIERDEVGAAFDPYGLPIRSEVVVHTAAPIYVSIGKGQERLIQADGSIVFVGAYVGRVPEEVDVLPLDRITSVVNLRGERLYGNQVPFRVEAVVPSPGWHKRLILEVVR